MKKINVGVIGLGVGEQHLKSLKNNNRVSKIKIYDKNFSKLKKISKKYSVEYCDSENDIFNDNSINLVCLASYDKYHYNQILKCLKKNKHIFIEKPALTNHRQAKEISKLLKSKKVFFGSNYILRKSPRFIKIKEKIKKNYFGKIYYIEADYNYGRLKKITNGWRSLDNSYSITLGGGIHLIDLVLFFLNNKIKVKEIKSYANKIVSRNSKFSKNDFIVSIIKMNDNSIIKITSNFGCVYPHFHKIAIYGEKRSFEQIPNASRIYSKRDKNEFLNFNYDHNYKNKGEYLNSFINSILTFKNRKFFINEIFESLAICFAIDKSINQKKSIKVKYY
tara:strand:+ start:169 stop:1170 length:1002 start_codon:yes stop_codon:yes gene_type:complete